MGVEALSRDKSDRFYEAEMLMEQVEDSPKKEKQAQAGRAYSNMRRAGGLGGGRGLGRLYQSLESTRKWAERTKSPIQRFVLPDCPSSFFASRTRSTAFN